MEKLKGLNGFFTELTEDETVSLVTFDDVEKAKDFSQELLEERKELFEQNEAINLNAYNEGRTKDKLNKIVILLISETKEAKEIAQGIINLGRFAGVSAFNVDAVDVK